MKAWGNLISLLLFSLAINNAYAQDLNTNIDLLTNYDQLVKAVESGNDVKAIVYFENCRNKDSAIQNLLAQYIVGSSTRFNFTEYLRYTSKADNQTRNTVTTTMTVSVDQPLPGVVWKIFGRLSVYDTQLAIVHIDYFDPVNQKSHLVVEWECAISKEVDDANGLVLINSID